MPHHLVPPDSPVYHTEQLGLCDDYIGGGGGGGGGSMVTKGVGKLQATYQHYQQNCTVALKNLCSFVCFGKKFGEGGKHTLVPPR